MRKTLSFAIMLWGGTKQHTQALQVLHLNSRSVREITLASTPAKHLQKSSSSIGKQRVLTSAFFDLRHQLEPYFIKYFSSTVWTKAAKHDADTLEQLFFFLNRAARIHTVTVISPHEFSEYCNYPSVLSTFSAAYYCGFTSCSRRRNCLLYPILNILQCFF